MTRCVSNNSSVFALVFIAATLTACSSTGSTRRFSEKSAVPVTSPASPSPATIKGDAEQRFKVALQLMKSGQPEDAQTAFMALAQEFPMLSGPHTNLGILYAQARKREQAAASLLKAVNANPNNALALNWLGTLYREGGDFMRAEQFYRRALTARGDYADAYLNLAILYDVSLRRPQDAMVQYRNYQRVAGADNLIVSAWIKELETSASVAIAARSAGSAGAMP
jgi:tetratricopeptide (TPR) repeat protein